MMIDRGTALHASKKIRLMQRGNILTLISLAALLVNAILSLILALNDPITFYMRGGMGIMMILLLLSAIAATVGVVMYLVGLYGMGDIRPEYRNAFLLEIVLFVVGLVIKWIGTKVPFGQVLETARQIAMLAVLWLVLQGTQYLLESLEQKEILRSGKFLWRLNIAATVLASVYGLIPIPEEIRADTIILLVIGMVISLFAFVAAAYYVIYLGKAANALEQAGSSIEPISYDGV